MHISLLRRAFLVSSRNTPPHREALRDNMHDDTKNACVGGYVYMYIFICHFYQQWILSGNCLLWKVQCSWSLNVYNYTEVEVIVRLKNTLENILWEIRDEKMSKSRECKKQPQSTFT